MNVALYSTGLLLAELLGRAESSVSLRWQSVWIEQYSAKPEKAPKEMTQVLTQHLKCMACTYTDRAEYICWQEREQCQFAVATGASAVFGEDKNKIKVQFLPNQVKEVPKN